MDHVKAAAAALERYLAERNQPRGPLDASDAGKHLETAIREIVAAVRHQATAA